MKIRILVLALCCAVLGLVVGCEKSDNGTTPAPPATSSALYVLNGLGKTLSVIDLNTGGVTNNVANCGTYPNQVVYNNGKLYVVNSGSNNVQIFDATSFTLQATITLPANNNPMTIAILSDTKAYIACSQSNMVILVNPTTQGVVKNIPAGVATSGVIIANNKVYAMNSNYTFSGGGTVYGQGTVSVISTTTDTVVATINVGTNPQAAAIAPDGKIHVVCSGDYGATPGVVSVIDPTTDAVVKTVAVGGTPGNIAISSISNRGYLGSFGTGLITYNALTYAIVDSVSHQLLGKGGSGTAIDLSGNVYVADFGNSQVDKLNVTDTLKATYNVGQGPLSLAIK
jgi:YVTN family beta-propeller protein